MEQYKKELVGLFGPRASESHAVLEMHGHDESYHETALPDLVVYPKSTVEVAGAVRICRKFGVPMVPFGAGTSLEGHVNAVRGGVSIDLSEMNKVVAIHPEDLDCVVQAGVRRKQLNLELRDLGLFFPIDPGPDATIGGMAATRASGTNAVRYGTMAENILSLTVVTATGEVIRTRARAKKSSTGYDLTHLYVGSEGTLGIITEVTLKLHGLPEASVVARTTFDTVETAVTAAAQAIQFGVPVARVELLDEKLISAINAFSGTDLPVAPTLFFELHGSETGVREQLDFMTDIAESNGAGAFEFAERQEDRTCLWQARHDAYYAASRLRKGAVGLTTDACVPISCLAECIEKTRKDLESLSVPGCILGHVGDGNFHVVFSIDPNAPDELDQVKAFSGRLSERAIALEGTCSGEHGVGLGKIAFLEKEHGPALEVMKLIKQCLDPDNLMNPGKMLDL